MVGHGGSSAGSYLADPTSPIPSHCASIAATSTLRVKLAFWGFRTTSSIVYSVGFSTEIYNSLALKISLPWLFPRPLPHLKVIISWGYIQGNTVIWIQTDGPKENEMLLLEMHVIDKLTSQVLHRLVLLSAWVCQYYTNALFGVCPHRWICMSIQTLMYPP